MEVTSAKNVVSSSWVSLCLYCKNIASNILLIIPIILSQTPPICVTWGGLNDLIQPCSIRYLLIVCIHAWRDAQLPTDTYNWFCSQNVYIWQHHEWQKKKRKMPQRVDENAPYMSNIDLITSMWIPRGIVHVNITAHRLLLARPHLVRRKDTPQGPNIFKPVLVKEEGVLRRSVERSAIFNVWVGLRSFRQVMQW